LVKIPPLNLKLHKEDNILNITCFELNRCEVTWSSAKSFSDLHKQTQALLLSPVFFVSGLQSNN